MDNLEDDDDGMMNELGLGTLEEEILATQTYEGECNNLSAEMPDIVSRTTDAYEGNNNEVEEEISLRLSKFLD